MFYVLIRILPQKQEGGPRCLKGCFLFLVYEVFIFQLSLIKKLFYVLIKFSLFSLSTDLLWHLPFSRYKGVKMGPIPKFFYFDFKSDFSRVLFLDSLSNFLHVDFKQI